MRRASQTPCWIGIDQFLFGCASLGHTPLVGCNDRGRLIATTSEWDYEADGTVDSRNIATKAYDPRGNEIQIVYEYDYPADGRPNERQTITNTYDRKQHLVRRVYAIDWNADGLIDYAVPTINTYDRYGRLVTTSTDEGWARRVTTNRYDRRDQLVEQEEEWDVVQVRPALHRTAGGAVVSVSW